MDFTQDMHFPELYRDKLLWKQFSDAYEEYQSKHVVPYIQQLSDLRRMSEYTHDKVKLLTLHMLGFSLDDKVLDGFNSKDLFILIKDFTDYASYSGTVKLERFLARLLRSKVEMFYLWTRDYVNFHEDLPANEPEYRVSSLSGDPLPAWLKFDPNVRKFFGISSVTGVMQVNVDALDGGVVVHSEVVKFAVKEGNYFSHVFSDTPFAHLKKQLGVKIKDGGHWFLSTHVRVHFEWSKLSRLEGQLGESLYRRVYNIFYALAPANLVLEGVVGNTYLPVENLCICAHSPVSVVRQYI